MRLLSVVIGCLAAIASGQQPEQPKAKDDHKIVILAEKRATTIQYVINGDRLGPRGDLLRATSDLRENVGTGTRTFLVVSDNLTIREIANITGILSKAGLDSIRIFSLNSNKTEMSEIISGKNYLFDPKVETLTPMHCGQPCPSVEVP